MTASDLRAWRQAMNLSRKQAAAAMGVSWRSVEAWEQGRKIPAGRVKMMEFISKDKEAEVKNA